MATICCPLMPQSSAIAIGALAADWLEDAERLGLYRRGVHKVRPSDDDTRAQHFYDLEIALRAIESDIGRKIT